MKAVENQNSQNKRILKMDHNRYIDSYQKCAPSRLMTFQKSNSLHVNILVNYYVIPKEFFERACEECS